MAKRNIVWTKTADLQFVGILEYWVKRNKSSIYSIKLLKLVSERTRNIAENPFIYSKTSFKDIRVSSLENFSIFYRINDVEIVIMAFWDNRQDFKKLLKLLNGK